MEACQARGRDIIIIATEMGMTGGSVTRRYLNVPPSPDTSPVSCMSPSDIILKTGSPNSPEGDNVFNFRGTSEWMPPALHQTSGRRDSFSMSHRDNDTDFQGNYGHKQLLQCAASLYENQTNKVSRWLCCFCWDVRPEWKKSTATVISNDKSRQMIKIPAVCNQRTLSWGKNEDHFQHYLRHTATDKQTVRSSAFKGLNKMTRKVGGDIVIPLLTIRL